MALCTSCGNQVEESASFCTSCGHPMPAGVEPSAAVTVTRPVCSSCGAQVDPDSAFCTECGQRVATQPVPVPVVDTVSVPAAPAALSAEVLVASTPLQAAVAVPLPVESTPAEVPVPPPVEPVPEVAAPVYVTPREYQPAKPGGSAFRIVILILLLLILIGGFGGWYFMGVETVIVASPPDVTVFLDDKELAPTSYGRYVIPHLPRGSHLLKVQRPGFADTIQRLDFPLTSLHEWVNIKLVPRRQQPSSR
jgi:DNA-directed RNA polymerase subunit RPC12/RpoP